MIEVNGEVLINGMNSEILTHFHPFSSGCPSYERYRWTKYQQCYSHPKQQPTTPSCFPLRKTGKHEVSHAVDKTL